MKNNMIKKSLFLKTVRDNINSFYILKEIRK